MNDKFKGSLTDAEFYAVKQRMLPHTVKNLYRYLVKGERQVDIVGPAHKDRNLLNGKITHFLKRAGRK